MHRFEDPDSAQSRVVGVVTAAVRWRSLFGNLFQEATSGVLCVVGNSFGQVFTLEVNGDDVVFVGFGDHHDSKYDKMVEKRLIYFKDVSETLGDSDHATYTVDIYPSEVLEPLFLTAKPAIYGSILFTVFAFTSVVFLAYDCFVETRQQVVANSADQARALVNSLFPEVVGNRLIEEQRLQNSSGPGHALSLFGGVHTGKIDPNISTVPIAGELLAIAFPCLASYLLIFRVLRGHNDYVCW